QSQDIPVPCIAMTVLHGSISIMPSGTTEPLPSASSSRRTKTGCGLPTFPPYTNQNLAKLLRSFHSHPHVKRETRGKTVGGRYILLLTVTNPKVSDEKKRVVWLMARQHSWEAGTSWVAEGLLRFLLSSEPQAVRIRDDFVFKIFPMADPDGVARGGVRLDRKSTRLNSS